MKGPVTPCHCVQLTGAFPVVDPEGLLSIFRHNRPPFFTYTHEVAPFPPRGLWDYQWTVDTGQLDIL